MNNYILHEFVSNRSSINFEMIILAFVILDAVVHGLKDELKKFIKHTDIVTTHFQKLKSINKMNSTPLELILLNQERKLTIGEEERITESECTGDRASCLYITAKLGKITRLPLMSNGQ